MATIADLKLESPDQLGGEVKVFYGRNPPFYAVFRSQKRVLIQFADAPDVAAGQRKAMAPLNPVRGEVNGLVEDWRDNRWEADTRKADCFDRRVGDALVVALEGDVPGAQTLLEEIKADVLADRTARARLQYVLAAAIAVFVVAAMAALVHSPGVLQALGAPAAAGAMYEAAGAGALGAFFSIALGVRNRTVLPDLHVLANSMDAVLRVLIGTIAASILIGMLLARFVQMDVGAEPITATSWLVIFIVGFLAGFSERLVPDLLSKVASRFDVTEAATAKPAAKTPPPAVGSPDEDKAAEPLTEPDEDPLPEEAAHDNCACDVELTDDETTADERLPPATGGIAPAGGGAG